MRILAFNYFGLVRGNPGCGKSHMLAALAGLLFCLRQMLVDPLSYIQSAMLCSNSLILPLPHIVTKFDLLKTSMMHWNSMAIWMRQHLYFIIDQINALEAEQPNADLASNSQKEILSTFLRKITFNHYSITAGSANYRTAHRSRPAKSRCRWNVEGEKSSFGCHVSRFQSTSVSQDEAEHHQGELPIFKYKSDKDRVEDLTGCIPLLLRPLLEWKDQDFCEIEQKFGTTRTS